MRDFFPKQFTFICPVCIKKMLEKYRKSYSVKTFNAEFCKLRKNILANYTEILKGFGVVVSVAY